MHRFECNKKMSLLEDWWDNLSMERPSHQTIFPYFRCNINRIDGRLDPNVNRDCERFVRTENARILTLKPANEPIWVCDNCYNKVKNNPRAYDIYGDKVCCVHNTYEKTDVIQSKNEHNETV